MFTWMTFLQLRACRGGEEEEEEVVRPCGAAP